jgi:adenylate kinase family enzyme
MVIGISGRIHSGKSTLANEMAKRMCIPKVSFGSFLRRYSEVNSLDLTRISLQDLGQNFVDNSLDEFCNLVLNEGGWDKETNLIVDGIRHISVLEKLKELVKPQKFILIFIEVSDEELAKRDIGYQDNQRKIFEQHLSEIQVISKLKSFADIVVQPDYSLDDIIVQINSFMGE